MPRLTLRAAILAAGLVLVPATARAQYCAITNWNDKQSSQGSGTVIGVRGGNIYVLTCWHAVDKPLTAVTVRDASGRFLRTFPKESVSLVASDKGRNDLALLRVATSEHVPVIQVMPEYKTPSGNGVLWGFPASRFSWKSGTMSDTGDLSFPVVGGGSGGPFVDRGYVTGVLVRYHACSTLPTIRSFLKENGQEWLLTNPIQRQELAATRIPPPRRPVTDLDRLERAVGQIEKMSDRDRSDLLLHILRQLLEDDE